MYRRVQMVRQGQGLCGSEGGYPEGLGLGRNVQKEIGRHTQKAHLRDFS